MNLYRIISARLKDHALSGEGVALVGGRWNMKGSSVVYTSTDLEAVTQEATTRLGWLGLKSIGPRFLIQIDVPDLVSRELVRKSDLPSEWNNNDWERADVSSPSYTQQLGAEWLLAGKTCLLFVPSGFMEGRINCLINPEHSDFAQIRVKELRPFQVGEKINQSGTADVFICHASEDKQLVVEPLAESLKAAGITYW
ncbi:MAG TPA: RES domain-containing protein, partial [Nitrososphaera sp.]|nr:RES domain-containing protein [Nitrososphaera sp.]